MCKQAHSTPRSSAARDEILDVLSFPELSDPMSTDRYLIRRRRRPPPPPPRPPPQFPSSVLAVSVTTSFTSCGSLVGLATWFSGIQFYQPRDCARVLCNGTGLSDCSQQCNSLDPAVRILCPSRPSPSDLDTIDTTQRLKARALCLQISLKFPKPVLKNIEPLGPKTLL